MGYMNSPGTTEIADDAVSEDKLTNVLLAEIDANTAKATNVDTDLTATANGTSLTINSSDGDNVALPAATTSAWGIMTDDHATAISANTSKVSYTDAAAITAVEGEATLLLAGQVNLRAGIEVCTSDPAPAIAESGTVYQFTKGSAGVFTLPASPTVGVQYVLVNGDGENIVITRPNSNYKINGSTSSTVTNTTQWAATSIVCVVAGSSGEWLVFGGI